MGGSEDGVAVYALSDPKTALGDISHVPISGMSRTDIDIGGQLAFVIKNVVTEKEADRLVSVTEGLGYSPAAPAISTPPGMRMNQALHWVDDDTLIGAIWDRIRPLLPQELDGKKLVGLSRRLNHYRYEEGDRFRQHIDGDWPGYRISDDGTSMVTCSGAHSKLSMLLYLNGPQDGVLGGDTRLFGRGGVTVDVTPCKGSALFFRHGFSEDSVMHEGTVVTGSTKKYVARVNVLYSLP